MQSLTIPASASSDSWEMIRTEQTEYGNPTACLFAAEAEPSG